MFYFVITFFQCDRNCVFSNCLFTSVFIAVLIRTYWGQFKVTRKGLKCSLNIQEPTQLSLIKIYLSALWLGCLSTAIVAACKYAQFCTSV
jgi:hypothetical protein